MHYPGAVQDPDTGELISDAQVAEIRYTAFVSTTGKGTARLIVRRVKDRNHLDALLPVWRYHTFFTDNTEPLRTGRARRKPHRRAEGRWQGCMWTRPS